MLSLTETIAIAAAQLEGVAPSGGRALAFTKAKRSDGGWLFFYNSEEFLTTGNMGALLGGNLPIFVSDDGQVSLVPIDDERLGGGESRGLRTVVALLEGLEERGHKYSVSLDEDRTLRVEVSVADGTWTMTFGLDRSKKYFFQAVGDSEPSASNVVEMWQKLAR